MIAMKEEMRDSLAGQALNLYVVAPSSLYGSLAQSKMVQN